jgi:nucleoside-diphosphate-sugar epimerase
MVDRSAGIFVAGHLGMVGSALVRCMQAQGYVRIVTRTRTVHAFLAPTRPNDDIVVAPFNA